MEVIIPPSNATAVSKAYKTVVKKTNQAGGGQSTVADAADSVALSSDAKAALEITKAAAAKARTLPETRDKLVESLQEEIQNEQYQPDHLQTAANMLSDLITGEQR
ncbi:MAG: flagellar biosynthesis anti-sigma factor FlgM [Thermacetogeniaceae bacterium]